MICVPLDAIMSSYMLLFGHTKNGLISMSLCGLLSRITVLLQYETI